MGNLHGLAQIRPLVSSSGVALPVRPEHHEAFWQQVREPLPRYMSTERCVPSFAIYNVNLGINHVSDPGRASVYLVLQAGGKWGYHDDYWERVEALAPLLEDARWYFDDEYTGFVDEFEIVDGALSRRRVVERGGDCWDYVLEISDHDRELEFSLHVHNAHAWEELGDEPQACYEAITQALAIHPDHAPSQLDAARYLVDLGRFDESLAFLHELQVVTDRALEASSDVQGTLTARLKQIYLQIGRAEAGRGEHEAALAAFLTSDELTPTWGNHEARIERAKLLGELGRSDEAQADLTAVLGRTGSKRQLTRAYMELARVHLGRDEAELARRRLEQVLELQPDWRLRDAASELLARL